MGTDTVLRDMLARNLDDLRLKIADAQSEMLKVAGINLDAIDDTETLARLVEGTTALVQANWPQNLMLMAVITDALAKKGEAS